MSLSTCQTHPNRWTLMSIFEKFCRMVGLEPIANVFTLINKPNFAKNWRGVASHKIWRGCRSPCRTATNLGLLLLLEDSSPQINNKPCLSSDEDKNYVVLDSTKIDYEVDKMTRGYYQAILQGIKSSCYVVLLFWYVLGSNIRLPL